MLCVNPNDLFVFNRPPTRSVRKQVIKTDLTVFVIPTRERAVEAANSIKLRGPQQLRTSRSGGINGQAERYQIRYSLDGRMSDGELQLGGGVGVKRT